MQSDELIVILEDEDELEVDLSDRLSIVPIDGAPHSKLSELDYEHSGHTGFMTSRLSLLNDVDPATTNDRLMIMANVNDEGSKYVNDVFIYYTDFIEYDFSQKNLIFKNFVVVENSVQIYYLYNKNEAINKEIENDINKTMVKAVVKPKSFDGIAKMFHDDLQAHGIKVKTGFGKFDITIQKSSKHPIAIIFEGSRDSNTFSVIDDYHYYYRQYKNRGWDIKVIYTYDLIDNYDKILRNTIEEIEGIIKK